MSQEGKSAINNNETVDPSESTDATNHVIPESMTITIQDLSGRKFNLDVKSTDTVEVVKKDVAYHCEIPVKDMRLIFKGKQVCCDERTLEDYGVGHMALMFVVSRISGGYIEGDAER